MSPTELMLNDRGRCKTVALQHGHAGAVLRGSPVPYFRGPWVVALRARRLASPGCSLTGAAHSAAGATMHALGDGAAGRPCTSVSPGVADPVASAAMSGEPRRRIWGPPELPSASSRRLRAPSRYVVGCIIAPPTRPVDTCSNGPLKTPIFSNATFSDGKVEVAQVQSGQTPSVPPSPSSNHQPQAVHTSMPSSPSCSSTSSSATSKRSANGTRSP